nr:hypothetical protein [Tanacetum cinerariifolium]
MFGKRIHKPFSHQVETAKDLLGLIHTDEHELRDHNGPTNSNAALSDPESKKWLDTMNVEMQSMKDNQVWDLVDLPPNSKIVGSKWLFKKKNDIDVKASRQWNKQLDEKIKKFSFTQNRNETCVYVKANGRETAYVLSIKNYKDRSRRLIRLCQISYIEKILKRFNMENSKRASIPMQDKPKLRKSQGDIKHKIRFSCFTDAGYLTDVDDSKSQTRYVFILNGGDVDWKSIKQSILATSSAKAEYIAPLNVTKEAVWSSKFISGLGVVPKSEVPMKMYCDNTKDITISNEPGITTGARHYRTKVYYLCEVIELGDIVLQKVHIDDNVVDPSTKAFPFNKHYSHTSSIGLLLASSLM